MGSAVRTNDFIMRSALLLLIPIVLGIAVGYGTATWELGPSEGPRLRADLKNNKDRNLAATNQGHPRIYLETRSFDFGVLPSNQDSHHSFVLNNAGDGPLLLEKGSSSCQCTVAEIAKTVLFPGEETEVIVSYSGKHDGPFSQRVSVKTSDPDEPEVTLHVFGEIRPWVSAEPEQFALGRISSKESKSVELRVYAFRDEPVSIVQEEWVDKSTAKFFELTKRPLTKEELTESHAVSGVLLKITIKSGLPRKRIAQKIRLTTNFPDEAVLQIPIEATVEGDVSIVGTKGWNAEKQLLDLGVVNRREEMEAKLLLVVRGPTRAETTFVVKSVAPELLKVEMGTSQPVGQEQQVWQTPLTIRIPAGSSLANHLGGVAGKLGEIVVESNNPDAPQTTIRVRFAVEE